MNVELLVVRDCPHEAPAAAVLRAALDDVGLGHVGYTTVVIESQDDAESRHFVGSPTVCIDGEDLFREPALPASVACRIYPGSGGVPGLRDLRQALKRAAADSASE